MYQNLYAVTTLQSLKKERKKRIILYSNMSTIQVCLQNANSEFFIVFLFFWFRYRTKTIIKIKMKIPLETSIYIRYLYKHGGMKILQIIKQYPQFAERSVYRKYKKEVNPATEWMYDKRKNNKGRRSKLSKRNKRKIIWAIPRRWEQHGDNFTAKRSNNLQDLLMCWKELYVYV